MCGSILGLSAFLIPAALSPSFFQKPPLLFGLFALSPVLDLVHADQCLWWAAPDVLVLAELTDPHRVFGGLAVVVGVLLLKASLTGSHGEFFAGSAWAGLFGRCSARLGLLTGRRVARRQVVSTATHVWCRLGIGVGQRWRRRWLCVVLRLRVRSGCSVRGAVLPGPDHLVGRVGLAGEGELGFRGG